MSSLDKIVRLVITKGTKTVSRAGFGTPLILGQHTRFAERIRFYNGASVLTEMLADGFLTSDAEYKAAQACAAQEQKPRLIAVGRRVAPVAQVITFTPTAADDTDFTVTINGTEHTFTSGTGATANDIVAGLLALINGGGQAAKVTATGTATLIVTSDNAGESFSYSNSVNIAAVETTAHVGVDTDIAAVIAEDNDWYGLCLTSRTDTDILVAAAAVETLRKIFIACSEAAGIVSSGSTDVGSLLEAESYDRTALLYSEDQESFPDAAWLGRCLPLDPGSETWKFKVLTGVTADDLSASEETNAENKNVNTFTSVGGQSITAEGVMASGEFIDVTRGIDWLYARIQEKVFETLINVDKVPYTDAGVAMIVAAVQSKLEEGVRVGLLREGSFEITAPKVADVDSSDKGDRLLPDVDWSAELAGAVHTTDIGGTVSV